MNNLKYYIVDNQGTTYGESKNKADAKILLEEYINQMKNDGMTDEQIKALELEIIKGN